MFSSLSLKTYANCPSVTFWVARDVRHVVPTPNWFPSFLTSPTRGQCCRSCQLSPHFPLQRVHKSVPPPPPAGAQMTPGKGSLCAWKVSPLTTTTTTFWSPSLPIYGLLLSVFGPRWPICAAGDAPEGFRASSPITPLTPKLNGGENWYPMCIDEVPNNKKQSVTKLASASVLITYLSTGIWWCDDSFPPQIPWIYTIYNEIRSP